MRYVFSRPPPCFSTHSLRPCPAPKVCFVVAWLCRVLVWLCGFLVWLCRVVAWLCGFLAWLSCVVVWLCLWLCLLRCWFLCFFVCRVGELVCFFVSFFVCFFFGCLFLSLLLSNCVMFGCLCHIQTDGFWSILCDLLDLQECDPLACLSREGSVSGARVEKHVELKHSVARAKREGKQVTLGTELTRYAHQLGEHKCIRVEGG